LFTASAATLLEIAADPKHLSAEIGILSILHTWGQNLLAHPHVHCVIPAGGISRDHTCWVPPRYPGFFLPVKVLSRVFRGKFIAGLKRLYRRKQLRCAGPSTALADEKQFRQLLRRPHRQDWVVYAKPAFGGPRQVLRYLGRYTHRVAISNHRLTSFDGEQVTFRWKDYAHGHRVLTPLLPACLAQRLRAYPSLRLFGQPLSCRAGQALPAITGAGPSPPTPAQAPYTDAAIWHCPHCGAVMSIIQRFASADSLSQHGYFDSS